MKYISFLIIPIIVHGVLALISMPKKAEKGKVYCSKFFAVLGVICSILFLIPTLITAFLNESVWLTLIFFAFSLLSATLIIAFINCRITYDEDSFVVKNFFGIKRRYTYDQITAIRKEMRDVCFYIGKRKVNVDGFMVGGNEFVAFAKKRYRSLHQGRAIPDIHKVKYDLFNGNVYNPGEFLFVLILGSLLGLASTVLAVWYTFFYTYSTDNTLQQQVIFEECTLSGEEMILKSADEQIYKIDLIDDQSFISEMESLSDGKTSVTVYSRAITPSDEEDYYWVRAIFCGDEYLLSFDKVNEMHRQEYWPLVLIAAILAVGMASTVTGTIIVGRNPKKYGKKIVKLFFKDGYVKY